MRIFLNFIIFLNLMNSVNPNNIPVDPLVKQNIASDNVENNNEKENMSPLDNPNQTNTHKKEQEEKIGTENAKSKVKALHYAKDNTDAKVPECYTVEPFSEALKEIRSQLSSNWISSIGIIGGILAICITFFWAIWTDKRRGNGEGHNGVSHSHLNGNGGTKQNQDFFLIGGIHDPFDLSYLVTIRDNKDVEHMSAERYYYYEMAQHFGEDHAMTKIRKAPKAEEAEEAVKQMLESIKSRKVKFDEWDKVKLTIWEEAQTLKFNQIRWIGNLLVLTKNEYLAVASDDDFFGTGVRKPLKVAYNTNFWNGQNKGGKKLMDIRSKLKKQHQWVGQEEEESISTMEQMRNIWIRA